VGAIVVFLFVLGLFVVRGPVKWWLASATVLAIMLSWGRELMWFTNLFIDYFPGYNKFRDVSMILVIAEFTMPLLGILGLWKIFKGEIEKPVALKRLAHSLYIVGGVALVFVLFPGLLSNFRAQTDSQLPDWLLEAIRDDRKSLVRQDAFRSLAFVLLSAGVAWAFVKEKLKMQYAILALGLLFLIDMWTIDRRYLNDENFARQREIENPFQASKADKFIMKDKDPNFRVLNLAVNTFNDASTSYFHHSVGGYHGAKMERYQELIEYHIQPEMQELISTLQNKPDQQKVANTLSKLEVLNMLNTRYIIYQKNANPLINMYALGNAWIVDSIQYVENADQEILGLNDFDPASACIVDDEFKPMIGRVNAGTSQGSQIKLIQYEPNHLIYQANCKGQGIAVFSEIYYPKGWNAYINDKPVEHFRANYVLRGLIIPEGAHKIEFKFKPDSYFIGNKVSMASSILLIIAFILMIGLEARKVLKSG